MSLVPADVIDREAVLRALNINIHDPKHQAMLLIAERYKLDPVLKHVVLISGNAYVTRDGLLHVAHQSGMLDGIVVEDETETDAEWQARVTVYVKGQRHGYSYRGRYPKSGQQKRYGPEMAVKCAEVMALRRAFGVTGIPTVEEQWDKADAIAVEPKVVGEVSGVSVPPAAATSPAPTAPGGGADSPDLAAGSQSARASKEQDATPSGPATDSTKSAAAKHCFAIARSVLDSAEDVREAQWDALVYQESGGRTTSRKELTEDEWRRLGQRMKDLSMHKGSLEESDHPDHMGWTITWKEAT